MDEPNIAYHGATPRGSGLGYRLQRLAECCGGAVVELPEEHHVGWGGTRSCGIGADL